MSKKMRFISLIVIAQLMLATHIDGYHLANYDEQVSSSSFGEPVFRLEPPSVINFANTQGATILCLVSGSPRPTVTWYSSANPIEGLSSSSASELKQSRPVGNVTNLRQISHNEQALRLLPFKEADFRQDIHSTEYRCVASNKVATIHSRSVLVQTAISSATWARDNEVKVSDEFVSLNQVAVFKCRTSPNSVQFSEFSQLTEWFTSDGLRIEAGETSKGNKFTAFKSGELHVNQVEMSDLRRTYGCRVRNTVTGQVSSSSGLAQLIVTADTSGQQQQKPSTTVLHTISQIIGEDSLYQLRRQQQQQARDRLQHLAPGTRIFSGGDKTKELIERRLLLPCAIRSRPTDKVQVQWLFQPMNSQQAPTRLDQFAAQKSIAFLHHQHQATSPSNSALNRSARYNQNTNVQSAIGTKFFVGPTHLAIEWPTRAQSGRYICQVIMGDDPDGEARSACDINVIIQRPIELSIAKSSNSLPNAKSVSIERSRRSPYSGWLGTAANWLFGPPERSEAQRRLTRHLLMDQDDEDFVEEDFYNKRQEQAATIKVRGSGVVEAPPVIIVGQRLQLECRGSGHPIESVKWFRNGQPVNTQTSADFHTETMLAASFEGWSSSAAEFARDETQRRLLSTLLVRQVQPKEVGLNIFECFASNSLGDRARAGIAVLVLDRAELDRARSQCPVRPLTSSNASLVPQVSEDFLAGNEDSSVTLSAEETALDLAEFSSIRGQNPLQRALVLEGEPVELVCPQGRSGTTGQVNNNVTRVEWRRLAANAAAQAPVPATVQDTKEEARNNELVSRNFNQLFVGGDSRFVINGSSLQIRLPAKRHDEALYVCRSTYQFLGSGSGLGLHQSSLASRLEQGQGQWQQSLVSCNQLIESTLFPQQSNITTPAPMSSISIRIVAKPKIDPFEFSRNLEEGMRTVVVCAVILGQSPVDITWFKDGNLLLQDEQLSLDQANGFSSTLTFHRIKSTHSGFYTCVAANAFATANHTSQLLVNVAPYLIDPPKNTRAILGSNVLVNCQAGGQPSPQIRWRKLVPIGPTPHQAQNLNSKQLAPSTSQLINAQQGAARPEYSTNNGDFLLPDNLLTTAPSQQTTMRHSEFRIVTSNSHIQVLENGSMIIKEVELNDASRYVCQAFNGISPSLSEVIELQVLQPAQFEVNYETISVKRDSSLKFNCAPRGDQPMQIEWRKEDILLAPLPINSSSTTSQLELAAMRSNSKYLEVATYYAQNQSSIRQRHSSLTLIRPSTQVQVPTGDNSSIEQQGLLMSELHITYADRSDSGTFVCVASNAYGKDELIYRLVVQEPPDAPQDVQLRGGGTQPDLLKLHWTADFDGNLPLSHFVVEYRRVITQTGAQSPIASSGEWTRLLVNVDPRSISKLDNSDKMGPANGTSTKGQQYSVQLRQLQARSHYQARVAAVNAMGQSAYSQVSTAQTAEEPPTVRPDDLRAEPVSSTSLKVLWRGPQIVEEQAPIKGYYVSHRKLGNNKQLVAKPTESANQWTATSTISAANRTMDTNQFAAGSALSGYELVINQLERDTRYEVRVQPYNSMGTGPSSDTVGQTLKFDRPAQPSIKLVAARRQSLELKWFISDEQPLMGFSLFYKCEYDDWQEIQLGLIYHYVIENLRCGNKYQIYLSAFNQVGRSDPSDVLSVRTEGTAPVPPDKSQFFRANISELVLDMRGWKSGGCPISSFMIQFRRLLDTNWFILSESQNPFTASDKITIPDLAPATWYKLMVTALNEAGSTNAEYLFSTLTTSGEQIAPNFPIEGADENWPQDAKISSSRSMLSGLSQLLFAATGGRGNHQDSGNLLLPFACIFLVLLTTVASYLYYSSKNTSGSRSSTSSSSSSSATGAKNYKQQPGGSPNLMMGQMSTMHGTTNNVNGLVVGCSSFANNLNTMRCKDEKQLIIEAPGTRQQTQHMLTDVVYHPSPPSSCESNQQHQQHQHAFDTLLNNTGRLQTFDAIGAARGQPKAAHGMRLLSSGNLFCGPSTGATSSSLSTHSTNCNFDGSSVQGSSSNASSGGKATKLQLIDESSLISNTMDELVEQQQQQQQQYLYGNQHSNQSPAHQQQLYSSFNGNHVDMILSQVAENHDQQGNEMYQHQIIDASNFCDMMTNQTNRQLYASSNNQRLSNSFASGADLTQRQAICNNNNNQQQQQQQAAEEPIYQRLENFQMLGLPTNKQSNTFARAKSQTLRYNHQANNFNSLDNDCDNLAGKFAQTLHRNIVSINQQQQEFVPQQHIMTNDGYYPAQSVHQQVQMPPAPMLGFNPTGLDQNVITNTPISGQQQNNCNFIETNNLKQNC